MSLTLSEVSKKDLVLPEHDALAIELILPVHFSFIAVARWSSGHVFQVLLPLWMPSLLDVWFLLCTDLTIDRFYTCLRDGSLRLWLIVY